MALHLYAAVLYEKQNSGATALDQPAKQKNLCDLCDLCSIFCRSEKSPVTNLVKRDALAAHPFFAYYATIRIIEF